MIFQVDNLNELNKIVEYVLPHCTPNKYLLLSGDLGAGKTTFTKKLLSKLGVIENVTSPTFTIMNQYEMNTLFINHMDAYRLNKEEEIDQFEEQFDNAFNIIE